MHLCIWVLVQIQATEGLQLTKHDRSWIYYSWEPYCRRTDLNKDCNE
jgi:hypothetical protein